MLLAHSVLDRGDGVPLPAWLSDVVLIGIPLLVLLVGLLVLEARTRPKRAQEKER